VAYNTSIPQLPDPTTTPVGPGWASQTIYDIAPVQSTELNGGSTIAVYQGGNYWNISLSYNSMLPETYNELGVFLSSLQGSASRFYVRFPDRANPKNGAWVGSGPQLGQGLITKINAQTIEVANRTSLGGTLVAGDYLKLSGNDRIYKVIKVENVSTSVRYTLHCVIDSPIDNTTELEPNEIKFKCVLVGDKPREEVTASGLVQGFSLALRGTVL